MKRQFYVLIVITLIVFLGCKKDKKINIPKVVFSLDGAKAIIHDKDKGTRIGATSGTDDDFYGEGEMLKIDENGAVSSAVEGITIRSFRLVPGGLYVLTSDMTKFFVKPDNSYQVFDTDDIYATYVGYNSAGDILFSDLSVFRVNTLTVEKLNSLIPTPIIESVSGEYCVIADIEGYKTVQVMHTVTGVRYNVNTCCRRVIDLGSNKVFVNDCSTNALMDMTTGVRTSLNYNVIGGEVVTIPHGIITCSQGLDVNASSDWVLAKLDTNGFTLLSNDSYLLGSGTPIISGEPNQTLFGSGDYLVIKEINQLSIFNVVNSNKTTIMAGYNIISVSVKDNKIYFLAETSSGDPQSGIYDLVAGTYTLSNSTSYYDMIEAF